MTHPNNLAYQQFVKLFCEANQHGKKSKQLLLSEAMTCWKSKIKKSPKDPLDKVALDKQMDELRIKIEQNKKKQSIKFSFLKQTLSSPLASSSKSTPIPSCSSSPYPSCSSTDSTPSSVVSRAASTPSLCSSSSKTSSTPALATIDEILEVEDADVTLTDESIDFGRTLFRVAENYFDNEEDGTDENSNKVSQTEALMNVEINNASEKIVDDEMAVLNPPMAVVEEPEPAPVTPKQDQLNASLNTVNSQLLQLQGTSRLAILDDSTRKLIKSKMSEAGKVKKNLEKQLKRAKQNQKHTKKYRLKKKKAIKAAIQLYPEVASILKGINRESPGNPRIECDQPEILEEILKIAEVGSACSDRRRDNTVRTVRTLDQLKTELNNLGFQVSRSGIYLKLLPRDAKSIEGRRHVSTVPVRLIKPQNNLRKGHKDRIFARETCAAVDQIAFTLGPEACTFLSQDDKSQVGIGVTCAKVQAPMLMSMSQRVRLPDHDFVIGSKHKLTPSVIGKCEIDPVKGVTYSGLTFVSIRSSKHNNSSALTHIEDLSDMIDKNLDLFESDDNDFKPVLIKTVDGGPDENPRFEKNILGACQVKRKYKHDAVIEVTNAPGLSAFNRVERRMHPLSLAMAGVILPHDTFGSHLDSQGKTVDFDLEKENFAAAGQVLADVFGNITIDGHEVQARYVANSPNIQLMTDPGGKYRDRHVIETQYLTAVLSCDDRSCCPTAKTSILSFFPGRRIPALIPIIKTERGPVAMELLPNIHKKDLEFLDVFGRIVLEKQLVSEGKITLSFSFWILFHCLFVFRFEEDIWQRNTVRYLFPNSAGKS